MATDPRVEVVARALLDVSEAWPRTGDALDDAYLARKYARAAVAALDAYDAPKFSSVTSASGAAPVPDPDPTCACGHPRSAHNTVGCVTRTLDPAQEGFFCPCMVSWYEVAP